MLKRMFRSQLNSKSTFFLMLLFLSNSEALLCSDVLQNSEEIVWSKDELTSMTSEEVDKCITQLGKVKIPLDQARIIWNSLTDFYGGAELIPDEKLAALHWITIAIEPSHYKNMTLSSIDVIENFGLFYGLSQEQLNAIAARVKEDWGGKAPEDYTSYDLMAMRQIICAFDPVEIEKIHPSAYKDAAIALGTLKKCPINVLEALAKLAVDEKAFKDPGTWNLSIISTIGVVMDGLPPEKLRKIPEQLMKNAKERLHKITQKPLIKS